MAEPSSTTPAGARPDPRRILRAAVAWLARRPWVSFFVIFLLSFAIRAYFLTKVPEDYVRPHTRWELSAVAVSLAERGAFADPYAVPTGPTAHLPPIVPAIYGAIFRAGGMTLAAGYAAWLFSVACYSALFGMLPWVAGRFGLGRPAGLLAGVAGALIVRWPGHGEGLAAILLGLLLVGSLWRWAARDRSPLRSGLLGAGWGAAFHVQPALLPVMLGAMSFELWWRRSRRTWLALAAMALGVVIACAPWAWRNYAVFGEVLFIRSNFGLELRMGNHDGAAAAMEVMDARQEHRHPRTHLQEARKLQEIGEIAYMRLAGAEALQWITDHPGAFVVLTAQRALHFWCGPLHRPATAAGVTAIGVLAVLGLCRSWRALTGPQRAVILIPLLTFPLVYYVVAYMIRYTEPVGWLLLVLAGAEIWRWMGSELEE